MANPTWFDAAHYKAQKLAQLQATDSNGAWTAAKLDSVLTGAGFGGDEGAFAHFTAYGADEHCSPNATFNAAEYLAAKLVQLQATDKLWAGKTLTDVQNALKSAGLGEYEHYQLYGSKEGLNPSNAFDEVAYLDAKLTQLVTTDPTNWTGKTTLDVRASLQASGLTALEHYLAYGKTEGIVAPAVADDAKVTVPADFYVFGGKGGMPSAGFDLTRGTDNLTGTAGNDSFFASEANGFPTLNPTDSLNGGAGEDTLYIGAGAGSENFAAASIKNIENVVAYGSVDVSANADVKNVTVMAGGIATAKMAQKVTLQDATGGMMSAQFVDAIGKEDAVSVKVANNDLTLLNIGSIEKLTLDVTGRNARYGATQDRDTATVFGADGVQEFVVTGDGSLKFANGTVDGTPYAFSSTGALKSLDFSANKGGVEMEFNSNVYAKAVTVKGGAGDDKIVYSTSTTDTSKVLFDVDMGAGNDTFEVVKKIHKDAKFNGGEGTDTLVLNGVLSADMTLDFANHFTGFETVTLKGGANAAETTYVNSYFKGITDATVVGDQSHVEIKDLGTVTVTDGTDANAANAATVTSLEVTANAVDLSFDNMQVGKPAGNGIVVTALTLNNTSDLTIHSDGYTNGDGNSLLALSEGNPGDLDTITIDGDQDFVLGASGAHAFTATGLGKIDASGLTGDLTVDLRGTNSAVDAGLKIIGGEGDDTFITGAGNTTNASDKHVGWGVKLTGGEGDDTFNVSLSKVIADPASDTSTAKTWASRAVVITDFEKGDTIKFAAGTYAEITSASKYTYTGVEDDLEAIAKVAVANGSEIKWFTDKTDSYIVCNKGTASNYTDDVIVKVAGVTDLSGITINADGELTWA